MQIKIRLTICAVINLQDFKKIESMFTLTIPHTIPHHLKPR